MNTILTLLMLAGCYNGYGAQATINCSLSVLRFDSDQREACEVGAGFATETANELGVLYMTVPAGKAEMQTQAIDRCSNTYIAQPKLISACVRGVTAFEESLAASGNHQGSIMGAFENSKGLEDSHVFSENTNVTEESSGTSTGSTGMSPGVVSSTSK